MEMIEIPKIKCKNEDVKTLFRMAYIGVLNPNNEGLCEEGMEDFASKTSLKAVLSKYGAYALSPFFDTLDMIMRLKGIKVKNHDFANIEPYIPFLEKTFDITIKDNEEVEEIQSIESAIDALQVSLDEDYPEPDNIKRVIQILQEMYDSRVD